MLLTPLWLRDLFLGFRKNFRTCLWGGHISMVLEDYLYEVESTDLFDRGFGNTGLNFLERTELKKGCV